MEIPPSKNNFHCERQIDLFFGKDHQNRRIAVAIQENDSGKFGMVFHYANDKPSKIDITGGHARCPEKTKLSSKNGKLAFVERRLPRKGEDFLAYITYKQAGSKALTFPMDKTKPCVRRELGIRIGELMPKHKF
ncbi:MAG: hypothetical protein WC408_06700 [Candidatus Micrarchaeia archaeon]|jgi:hypothetical protein